VKSIEKRTDCATGGKGAEMKAKTSRASGVFTLWLMYKQPKTPPAKPAAVRGFSLRIHGGHRRRYLPDTQIRTEFSDLPPPLGMGKIKL
jgi:hypothetical protein